MFLKMAKMTVASVFKKPITLLYPFETKPAPAGLKGHIGVNEETCICCGICAKRCPCSAIEVSRPDMTWSINRFQCVQCGTCIRECPKNALIMESSYPSPSQEKSIFCVTIGQPKKDE